MHIEIIAILEALSLIVSYSNKKFVILSDSKSAFLHLARLTSNIRGYPLAYRILKCIYEIEAQNKTVYSMDTLTYCNLWVTRKLLMMVFHIIVNLYIQIL